MKKIIYLGIIGAGVYVYSTLTESKKRFIKDLVRQVPYLVPRYFV
ncbi:MAG TPA: hypothetical protein VIS94_11290 [Desulfomonilia bacterium]|jgi:hypothetical protein